MQTLIIILIVVMIINEIIAIGAYFKSDLDKQQYLSFLQDDGSNLMKHNTYEQEWHKATDVPCPGSLIVCEDTKHQLYFGYAVAYKGRPCLWQLPNYLSEFRKPPATVAAQTLHPTMMHIPIVMYNRWQYIERRILPTETLRPYIDQYKEESK